MKTILSLLLSATCFGAPLEQIANSLDSRKEEEKSKGVALLKATIDDKNLPNETRLGAVRLSMEKNVHECSGMIIKYIDQGWVRIKSPMSVEQSYPCVEALIAFGDKSVPPLIEALKTEDNELRRRLMSYSLRRILKKPQALAYLDKLIGEEIPAAEKRRLEAAKAQISKWSDYESLEK